MKNKKIVWVIIGIVAIALIALAITYAYWQITKTQTGENEITTACLDITLEDTDASNTGISLTSQYPISDIEGAELTPYKFTVTNNCDTAVDYQIALESIGDSTTSMQASSIKVMLDSNTATLLSENSTVTPTISGAYASHKLGTATLAATGETGSSVTHTLRLWIDEAAPVSEANKTFESKISITIGQGIEKSTFEEGTVAYSLIEAAGGESTITELNSTSFAASTTASDAGIYKTTDDYGTSYYYRGNVTNNYVQFGSYAAGTTVNGITYENETPMYWRIVRINGDGTIRMIYAGTTKTANGESNDSSIGSTYYDMSNYMYDYAVGYMQDEEMNSNVKSMVDSWYEANLKTNYETYIADSIFCNDREYVDDSGFFKAYNRIETEKNPNLICGNKDDKFTVDDTTLGNGFLTNPAGLITADEAAFAGYVSGTETTSNYLSTGADYWTMSPYGNAEAAVSGSHVYYINENNISHTDVDGEVGIRPVINLKADISFTIDEDGTYVITTN